MISLTLAIPGAILSLNGHLDFRLNSIDNKVAPLTERRICLFKADADALYSAKEDDPRAAVYGPELFQYGKNGKKSAILVLGNVVSTLASWQADSVPEADVVWANIPGASLADAQVNAEYVTYAINYISAVSDSNVAVLSWSPGGLNVQWSFNYWPSTRGVVDDFIAISPDCRGSVVPTQFARSFPTSTARLRSSSRDTRQASTRF
ncbi:hypothetical protein BDW75DRAFT_241154 [Aspergillus navahoensis]